MNLTKISITKSLNAAYLKQNITSNQINLFIDKLKKLLEDIQLLNDKCNHEGDFKKPIIDFLNETYYKNKYFINSSKRYDLIIANGPIASDSIGVIIETKKPNYNVEMITESNPNAKALRELVHYYMQERLAGNDELKHLIATNGFEWYIFDAVDFEKLFYKNDTFFKQYEKWDKKQTVDSTTVSVYDKIKNFLDNNEINLEATYFDLRDFQQYLNSSNEKDIENIITLYKIFSPQHLLKLSFANDSNTLNKEFYNELLYILGLEERTENGKNIISRANANNRQSASLIENTINQLKIKANITDDDQLFEIALELCITWLNRILFLKLLEGQLIKFHNDDKVGFSFMTYDKIKEFDDFNELFFEVLALPEKDRLGNIKEKYTNIPYLNSSLFELTDYEVKYITINNLKDRLELPLYKSTVLKDANGKPRTSKLPSLNYLFEFLNSYDFSSDTGAKVQRDNRPIINAAVLGLIFEKINGYKDGSYFTPGYITEYMCREAIRKAVVDKFNEKYNWQCRNFIDLFNNIDKIRIDEANAVIDSIRICDPAVGSGHFLVSALNELIAIKSELNILADSQGKKLKNCDIKVENDELVILYDDKFFEYKPGHSDSQRVQETLFNEKQKIIENCLFGVDINSKSVQITRLRLWIELLKNAYYKAPDYNELETLPNIDINIKCGDSLISRYTLDSDLKPALRNSIWTIDTYKIAIASYHQTRSKKEKGEILKLINDIKNNFETEISQNHPLKRKLLDLKSKLFEMSQTPIFEYTENEKLKLDKDVKNITNEINKIESELEDIKNGEIYKNAFEWRFEFPEILDDDGNYIGFDVVIGNPPYGIKLNMPVIEYIKMNYDVAKTIKGKQKGSIDTYALFIELGFKLLKKNGILIYIVPISITSSESNGSLHKLLEENCEEIKISSYAVRPQPIFENAVVDTSIIEIKKTLTNCERILCTKMYRKKEGIDMNELMQNLKFVDVKNFKLLGRYPKISKDIEINILSKLFSIKTKIGDLVSNQGTPIYYRTSGGRYFKIITNYTTGSTKENALNFDFKIANSIGAILSSDLFFWYYQIYSNNHDLKLYDIKSFPIPIEKLTDDVINKLESIYQKYLDDIEKNAKIINSQKYSNAKQFKVYEIKKSKKIIEEIDDIMCSLYGLNEEEIDFIKNYEIEFRIGNDDDKR
jgi:hypothetical protein